MSLRNMLATSAFALLLAAPALAQGALVGVDSMDDRIDEIQKDVSDDLSRAAIRDRSTNQYTQGWDGSIALGLAATSGNTDTTDLSLAGRFRYGDGPWNHTFGFAAEYAEDNNVENKKEIYATYDVNRYFNDRLYVFGLGSVRYDAFNSNKLDAFVGAGPGYRFVNQEDMTWRVQAGPGIRYLEEQNGDETTTLAGLVSSRFFYKFADSVSLSNDTDVLFSEGQMLVTNDMGLNFRVSDAISTRISYRSEWDSNPLENFDSSDNSLGVSLVYGF